MAGLLDTRLEREEASIFDELYAAARQQEAALAEQGRRSVLGGLFSKEPVQGIDTVRFEGMPGLLSMLTPAAKAVDAPISAYRGLIPEQDMLGEAMGTAGMAMGGGGLAAGRNIGATNANASKSAGLLAASLPEPRNAGGLLGAAQQTKTPTMPTRKQFQNNHLVHVDVKGRQGRHDSQEVKASVLKNGFTGGQLLPAYKGGTPTNIIDEQYAPRKGDVIYVIPPEGWESRNGMEYIKKGYKPRPNFIIEAPEDFIDVYDVFSKSQAKTRKKQ